MADLSETLNNLKKMYLQKLSADLPDMEKHLDSPIDMEKLVEIRGIVHKLSGTGGMYGLKQLSEKACETEMKFNDIIAEKNDFSEDDVKKDFRNIIELIKITIKE